MKGKNIKMTIERLFIELYSKLENGCYDNGFEQYLPKEELDKLKDEWLE